MLLVVLTVIGGGLVACSNEKLDAPEKKNIPKNLLCIEKVEGIELEQDPPCSIAMYEKEEQARKNSIPIYLVEGKRKSISFCFQTKEETHIKSVEPVNNVERETMERKHSGAYLIKQKEKAGEQEFTLSVSPLGEEDNILVYRIEMYFDKYKYFAFEIR